MEFEGHALVNLHIAGYYYVPTAYYPLTHPKQLAACAMRRDSKLEERWACWACQIPVDPERPHQTGKVTFVTAKAQCYHWWQCHASKSQWDLLDDLWEFDISHEEMLMALGIDLKACPLPVGTAIDLIPMILPSHEAGHDPRIAEAPWCRKIAYASQPSEWGLPV